MDGRAVIAELKGRVEEQAGLLKSIREEVGRVIVGQKAMVDRLLIGLLADGHILLEGVPGLAKTTAVKALSQALHLDFSRIQFTPDLLPADVVGTQIYNPRDGGFGTRKGPIFANILLADEVNRAPAKVQSALLEAMQERQVTIGDTTFHLPRPFLVLATQNPVEQEGTYPLPEAQMDRFLMKLKVGYPTKAEEKEILRRASAAPDKVRAVCTGEQLMAAQELCRNIWMEDVVQDYIVELVQATRTPGKIGLDIGRFIAFGASPRATLALAVCSRAHAMLDGRAYVTPDDVKAIAPDVLRHRMVLTYEAEAEEQGPDDLVKRVLEKVKTP